MYIARTSGRIAAVLAAMSALTALAGVAQAGASTQPSTSKAEQTEPSALRLRSEALNERYGLGSQGMEPQGMTAAAHRALRLRSEALNEKYGLGSQRAEPDGMTAAAHQALRLRSEALNERYLGPQQAAAVTSQPTSSTRGFAWGAFGIGAATMVGLVLLAAGLLVRGRFLATLRGLTPRYRTT